jgi:vacuolar-type H+-ATPase subunit I/STV1
MRDQLTESQVARVVAEVTRQAQFRELGEDQVLERGQVVQILEELKLPVELLDPAMRELERREAEAEVKARYDEALGATRRRTFRIIGAALALVLVLILVAGIYVKHRSQAFAAIVAVEPGRITRLVDDGASIRTAARDGSEIYYRVMLDHVPMSENLSLKCNWIDPAGRIVKQNSWATKTTDKTLWPTSCRNTFGGAAQAGTWRVEMLVEDRVVSRTDFQVE